MSPSDEPRQARARTVGRILKQALADAAQGAPQIEPETQVWIKVEAPERLRLRRLSNWVWREGRVIQWIWQIEEGTLGP